MDVAGQDRKIFVLVHQDALVPALIQMSHPVMPPVVIAGIRYIELPHELGKISRWGLKKQVEVMGHQYVAVQLDRVDIDRLNEGLEKALPVCVVFEDILALVAAAGNVIYGAGVLYPEGAGHAKQYQNEATLSTNEI